jgi:hypothetical protein
MMTGKMEEVRKDEKKSIKETERIYQETRHKTG